MEDTPLVYTNLFLFDCVESFLLIYKHSLLFIQQLFMKCQKKPNVSSYLKPGNTANLKKSSENNCLS